VILHKVTKKKWHPFSLLILLSTKNFIDSLMVVLVTTLMVFLNAFASASETS